MKRAPIVLVATIAVAGVTFALGLVWQQNRLDPEAVASDRAQIERVMEYANDLSGLCVQYGYFPGVDDRYQDTRFDRDTHNLIIQTYQPGDPMTRCDLRDSAGQCTSAEILYGMYEQHDDALGTGEYVQVFSDQWRQFSLNQWNYRMQAGCFPAS